MRYEQITGTVTEIVFANRENGFTVCELDINDTDPERFLPFIEGAPLRSFQACNSFIDRGGSDPNALFASAPTVQFSIIPLLMPAIPPA